MALSFVVVFTIFEMIHTLLESYLDDFTFGVPILTVLINLIIASVILPVERYLRNLIKVSN